MLGECLCPIIIPHARWLEGAHLRWSELSANLRAASWNSALNGFITAVSVSLSLSLSLS